MPKGHPNVIKPARSACMPREVSKSQYLLFENIAAISQTMGQHPGFERWAEVHENTLESCTDRWEYAILLARIFTEIEHRMKVDWDYASYIEVIDNLVDYVLKMPPLDHVTIYRQLDNVLVGLPNKRSREKDVASSPE